MTIDQPRAPFRFESSRIHSRHSAARRALGTLAAGVCLLALSPQVEAAFAISATASPATVRPLQYAPGSSVTLTVGTSPAPTGDYQWFHDDQSIAGATAASLALTNLAGPDSGNYRLRVTSGRVAEFSANTVTLNVVSAPSAPLDSTFNAETPTDLNVATYFAGAADGSLILQCFPKTATWDYGNARSAIRLRADGTRDAALNLWLGSNAVLAVLPDGELITANSPYRFGVDGSANPFAPPAGFDSAKPLDCALAQPDGKFVISQGPHLVRLNADGSPDPSFSTDLSVDRFRSLRLDSAGRIIVDAYRNDAQNYLWYGVLDRLTATGQRDPTFRSRSATREWYYPSPLPGGGLLLEYYWSNYEGPLLRRLNDDGTSVAGWSSPFDYSETFDSVVADPTRPAAFWTTDLRRYLLTGSGIVADSTFYAGLVGQLKLVLPDGKLLVAKTVTNPDQTTASRLVRLRTTDIVTIPPNASLSGDAAPTKGSTFTITSTVTGTGPFTYQWLALDGQPLPADTTSAQLVIPNFSASCLGRYQLRVTGPGGVSVLSNVSSAVLILISFQDETQNDIRLACPSHA